MLFAPMYLDGNDLTGSSRLERNRKWISYYKNLKEELGYTDIYLVDNSSSYDNLKTISTEFPGLFIEYCPLHLPRLSEHGYGYWYRAFARAFKYAIDYKYDKIIHLDTDVFVCNDRICNYIKNSNDGWITFWSKIHNYPDATIQIINKNEFPRAHHFMTEGFLEFYPYKLVDDRIPYTHVEHGFIGDRYGDHDNRPQTPDMDFYGQCLVSREIKFNL